MVYLQDIIHEIDEDESGSLEFPEFIQLAAKFLIEEDEEQMRWELKEAFRIYDKQGIAKSFRNIREVHCSCDFFGKSLLFLFP